MRISDWSSDVCSSYLVKAAAEAWYRWLKKEKRFAAHTLRAYGQDLAGFLAFLAEHLGDAATLDDLRGLRQSDFRAWLSRRRNDGLAATSLARSLRAVRSFFRRLQDRKSTRLNSSH